MEIIIALLIEKGGVFGILLIGTWIWVWWTKTGQGKEDAAKDQKEDIAKKIEIVLIEIASVKDKIENLESDFSTGGSSHIEHEKVSFKVHESVKHIGALVKDLHDWHSVKDSDGLPIWYIKRSLEDRIINLSDSIKADTDKLSQYSKDISKLNENRIDELKEVITNYNKTILDLTMALERVRMTLDSRGDG